MPPLRSGNKSLLRELNRSKVFNAIAAQESISRIELARFCNLPPSTITQIVSEFINAGLVLETTAEATSIGRPPVQLEINANAGYVIGVKFRLDSITIALCNLKCQVLHHRTIRTDFPPASPPHIIGDTIVEGIKSILLDSKIERKRVMGVGVGMTGIVDNAHGISIYAPALQWENVDLGPYLEFKLRLPVRLDNDVRTLALAEYHFGQARDIPNALLITVGSGIGLGVIINGEIYRGSMGASAEVGHMVVDLSPDADLCVCGKRGCLETIAADFGIVHQARKRAPSLFEHAHIDDVIQAALSGESTARAIFEHAGRVLGAVIANLINLYDPATVLIAGANELFMKTLYETVPVHVFGGSKRRDVPIQTCSTDDVIWARGAASLVLDDLLRPPFHETDQPLFIDTLLSEEATQVRRQT